MKPRVDRRARALLATLVLVAAGGLALQGAGSLHAPAAAPQAALQQDFEHAVQALQQRRFDVAVASLQRVIERAPHLPEAQANLGFALLGLGHASAARLHFERAIALEPRQANAYYGLALVHEAAGDLAPARGAMRSYLHLAQSERPEHLARARAALWEWQALPDSGNRFPGATSALAVR